MANDFRVYLRKGRARISNEVCRQVKVPKFLIPVIIAHVTWLEKNWLWEGTQEEIEHVKRAIDKFIYTLAYDDCDGNGEKPPDTTIIRKSVKQYQVMLWEMMSSMFDFDIEDYIRVKDGKLQLNIDNCDGCDWTTIWDLAGGSVQRTYDSILNEAGSLIDDAFKDVGGYDTPTNIPNKDSDLKRCAKATGFAILLWEYLNTLVDTWDTVTPDYDSSSFNLSSFANGIISGVGAALGISQLLLPALTITEIGAFVLTLNNDAIDEIRDTINDNSNLQKMTCFLYKHMTTRDRFVGEDVAGAIEAINAGGLAFNVEVRDVIVKIIRALPITKTAEFVDMNRVSNDCGCPDVLASIDPVSVQPELAQWYAVADFKTHQPSYYGFSTDYGDWISGEGLNGNYDGSMTRNFAFIFMGASGTAVVERVDVSLENVVKGQFYSGEGTPDNDIEGFYCRYRFFGGVPLAVKPIVSPVTSIIVGSKATQITLQFMFGYDERDPNTIPNQTGFGTITKVKVWGRGTVPSEYSTWAVTNV